MYEGRTRGKKLKYIYSDDEEVFSDNPSRRSTRNASSTVTPAESGRPRFTASGRQIRSRTGGHYGEALLAGQRGDTDDEEDEERPQRTRTSLHPNGYSGYGADDLEDESEPGSNGNDSGNEWHSGEEEENEFEGDDEEEGSDDDSIMNGDPPSLVVQLRYGKGSRDKPNLPVDEPPPAQDAQAMDTTTTEEPAPVPSTSQPTSAPAPTANHHPEPQPKNALPFAPAPQQQAPIPTPAVAAPPMATNPPEPIAQALTGAPIVTPAQIPPLTGYAEAPKPSHLPGPNGVTGDENESAPAMPHAQVSSSQSWNPPS